jgi:simple sugar transport system permease protein
LPIDGQVLVLIGALIVIATFFSVTEERFLTSRSIGSMAFQIPELGVLALGMMITMIIGGINLSIVDNSNLAALLAGLFLVKLVPAGVTPEQMPLYIGIAILVALATGVLCGVLNGLLVGYMGVDSILATLATLILYRGVSVGITKGRTLTGFPEQLSVIGHQTLFGIPISFVIFLVLAVSIYVILKHTTFGFKVYMLGTNPTAAKFSGIHNKSITMRVFILSGIIGAIAGIIVMSRTASAAYEYGTKTYILLTILISVMAGVSPGFGKVIAVVLVVVILQVLSTGFHMFFSGLRGSSFFKDFSWGVLLILFFIINHFTGGRKAGE